MFKKKVLIISPGLPFPPVDGHKLKLFNLILQLSKKVDLYLVVISNESVTEGCEAFLKENLKNYEVFRFSKLTYLLNLFKSIFNKNLPFQVAYYTFEKLQNYLKNDNQNYDYVFFNLIRTTGYVNIFDNDKVVLDLVDSIGINYLKSRKKTTSLFYKVIYSLETKRLLKHEKTCIKSSRLTLLVNKIEADYYRKYGKVSWLPNGVNKALFDKSSSKQKPIICFFGAMFYQPNVDAVLWFSKHVLPLLNPEINFYIIGGRPTKEVLRLQNNRIIVTGFIENPYDLITSAICTVAPMQTGGGIQNKILESMALGQITVTNNIGGNPITGSENLTNILIANTPEEFSYIINQLYNNPEKFQHIKTNAKNLILNNYSWVNYGKSLETFLDF